MTGRMGTIDVSMTGRGKQHPRTKFRPGDGRRMLFVVLGCLMLLLGLIGAFLPVMPTTIFLILAAWFFGRSSPRLEAWMLDHPRFGPVLRDWRAHGAMPCRAKLMACGGMATGYLLFFLGARPALWLAITVATFMIGCAAWIITRPEPPHGSEAEARLPRNEP